MESIQLGAWHRLSTRGILVNVSMLSLCVESLTCKQDSSDTIDGVMRHHLLGQDLLFPPNAIGTLLGTGDGAGNKIPKSPALRS